MTEEKLSDLERECLSHLLSYLRGLTNAREFWYLVALEQEHYASREALQMMQHVGKQQPAPKPEPEQEYQSVTYYPETDITVAIGPETPYDPENWPQHLHADDCQCHLCWAASLTPPSPPWEGGAA